MALYRQLAAAVGVEVCQILVPRSYLSSARAMGDLGQRLREAGGRGLLPTVNGNDATDPLSALDNDQVAVAVAVAAEASRLLFLTDVRAAYRDADLRERIVRLTPAQARPIRLNQPAAAVKASVLAASSQDSYLRPPSAAGGMTVASGGPAPAAVEHGAEALAAAVEGVFPGAAGDKHFRLAGVIEVEGFDEVGHGGQRAFVEAIDRYLRRTGAQTSSARFET